MGTFDQAPANAQPFDGSALTDPFDTLLVSTCQILMKKTVGSSSDDAYGQPPQTFVVLKASVPCRVTSLRGGNEYKHGKEFATNRWRIFMRPVTADDNNNPLTVTPHHWIRMNADPDVNPQDASTYDLSLFNITSVQNPSKTSHHLELIGEIVYP